MTREECQKRYLANPSNKEKQRAYNRYYYHEVVKQKKSCREENEKLKIKPLFKCSHCGTKTEVERYADGGLACDSCYNLFRDSIESARHKRVCIKCKSLFTARSVSANYCLNCRPFLKNKQNKELLQC